MAKDNLQLISVRIDPVTLLRIDRMAALHCYWRRNTIINSILTSVMQCFDDKALFDLVKYHPNYDEVEKAEFKIADRYV